jgi:hypothetical protein
MLMAAFCGCSMTGDLRGPAIPTSASEEATVKMGKSYSGIPVLGPNMWIRFIDGIDRRKYSTGKDGGFVVAAGDRTITIGWVASYLSAYGDLRIQMKPGHSYLTFAKQVGPMIEFWAVDAADKETILVRTQVSIDNRPPMRIATP